jgi:hypothetical protein
MLFYFYSKYVMQDLILIVRLQEEDLDDLTLLQKKVYFHLEEGSFYSGNILIHPKPEDYLTDYFFF